MQSAAEFIQVIYHIAPTTMRLLVTHNLFVLQFVPTTGVDNSSFWFPYKHVLKVAHQSD